MAIDILLPKLGFSMSEAVFVEWLVPSGQLINEGEPLFTMESDKSTQEIESPATGILRAIAEAGATYQVGDLLGTLE